MTDTAKRVPGPRDNSRDPLHKPAVWWIYVQAQAEDLRFNMKIRCQILSLFEFIP